MSIAWPITRHTFRCQLTVKHGAKIIRRTLNSLSQRKIGGEKRMAMMRIGEPLSLRIKKMCRLFRHLKGAVGGSLNRI